MVSTKVTVRKPLQQELLPSVCVTVRCTTCPDGATPLCGATKSVSGILL
jgi:hypothetical protein